MNTDEELYARFLCGEDDAIRQLMDRYLERLTLFCFTFLHSLTEAEDMALDAFAVIAVKRSVWYGGSFQRWLYRIARNLSISRYRKLRLIQVPFDEAHHLTEASVETVYWRREETEALKALLLRLRAHNQTPGRHRRLLVRRGGAGPGNLRPGGQRSEHGRKEGR